MIIAGILAPSYAAPEFVKNIFGWARNDQAAARFEQSQKAFERGRQIINMLKHIERGDDVEGRGGQFVERKRTRIMNFDVRRKVNMRFHPLKGKQVYIPRNHITCDAAKKRKQNTRTASEIKNALIWRGAFNIIHRLAKPLPEQPVDEWIGM